MNPVRQQPYWKQRETIINVISAHDNHLTQDQFDHEFADYHQHSRYWTAEDMEAGVVEGPIKVWLTPGKYPFGVIDPDGPILGNNKWLALIQWMAELGLVEITGKPPNIVYSRVKPKLNSLAVNVQKAVVRELKP